MNKHNAKDYLPLVQALAEGKEIQHRSSVSGTWGDVVQTSFSDEPSCYRIKPEPRKAWVWWPPVESGESPVFYTERTGARIAAANFGGHITEVTE